MLMIMNYLDIILDQINLPLIVINNDGMVIFSNKGFENMLGKNMSDILNSHILALTKGKREGKQPTSYLLETVQTGIEINKIVTFIDDMGNLPKRYKITTKLLISPTGKQVGGFATYNYLGRFFLMDIKDIGIASVYETILAFAEAIGVRDLYTMGHSERVAEYSRLVAQNMGLSPKEQDAVYFAGIVHDIGKIGVPENILNKPSFLDAVEFDVIKMHPYIGAQILRHVSFLEDISLIVAAHHEMFDGSGYPMGLKGEKIPLASRIISVADAFEAMMADRSYRKALPFEVAIEELKKGAGTQFDPEVVEQFLNLLEGFFNVTF